MCLYIAFDWLKKRKEEKEAHGSTPLQQTPPTQPTTISAAAKPSN
ncbi:hypothetical protein AK830_g8533 [Neonectria ditissima]|uniref:Uncharacterized protein n=1 Tax=Neonectria ditissima TaxID=78410 RepID=A0A0P7BB48_9HYPO|nr:hypothetical protein AK830_g8533 [Neonectria ditissima]